MTSRWAVVVGAVLVACAPAGGRGAAPPGSAGNAGEPAPNVVAAVMELTWTGSPPAKELAASESGNRAIAALVKWGETHPAVEMPCSSGADAKALAFVKRAYSFALAVIASSSGPEDPKVTALLQFAHALRREHNDGLVIMMGVKIPVAAAAYWRDRPLAAGTFAKLGPTDLDVVHIGQSLLDCRLTYVQERRSWFEGPDGQNALKESRRGMGLGAEHGWFEQELAAHDQFLAETRQRMAVVHTGTEMASFVEERMHTARESPSSAVVRAVSYGLKGDAIVSALKDANLDVTAYQKFVSPAP